MRRVPVLAILACLAALALAACGESAPIPATAPAATVAPSRADVAGETGLPPTGTPPSAIASPAIASKSPYPAGIDGALQFLQAYENDLIGGRYDAAWSMLAPAYQATVGTFDTYETDRTEFMATAGRSYTATANPTNIPALSDLIKGKPFAATIDQKKAVVLSVEWPTLVRQGTPPEVWIVNPAPGAGWELYRVS